MSDPARQARRLVVLALAGLALAACGKSNNNVATTPVTPPPVAATRLEDTFGTGFGTDFRVAANSEPADPTTADLNAVSLTTEPTALH